MFIATLEHKERIAFVELANRLILADGRVAPEEESMLADILEEADVRECSSLTLADLKEVCSHIDRIESQIYSLLELASIAYVDGSYDAEEQALIREIARLWNIELDHVLRIEDWGGRRVSLSLEAAYLLSECS